MSDIKWRLTITRAEEGDGKDVRTLRLDLLFRGCGELDATGSHSPGVTASRDVEKRPRSPHYSLTLLVVSAEALIT